MLACVFWNTRTCLSEQAKNCEVAPPPQTRVHVHQLSEHSCSAAVPSMGSLRPQCCALSCSPGRVTVSTCCRHLAAPLPLSAWPRCSRGLQQVTYPFSSSGTPAASQEQEAYSTHRANCPSRCTLRNAFSNSLDCAPWQETSLTDTVHTCVPKTKVQYTYYLAYALIFYFVFSFFLILVTTQLIS